MRSRKSESLTFLSVIVPVYKQEKTIAKDIRRIKTALAETGYPFEIIVVVDGIADKTYQNASRIRSHSIKVIGYEKNYGKGYAIRYGMVRAKGDVVGFVDSGMELNPNGLSMLLEHFKWYKADIIIGSKRHPVSKVVYPLNRKIISMLSQLLIRMLFGVRVRDTQVGMKFFRKRVIEDVLPRLLVKKFAFDIEILAVSYYLGYRRIYEAPIEISLNTMRSIVSQNLFPILMKTLWDTLAIFYRLRLLGYYSNSSKRKWKFEKDLNFKVNIG